MSKDIKVIQSYIPFQKPDEFEVVDKSFAYLCLLSSLQLKKIYGNVTLYTTKSIAEWFKTMDFPYTYDTSLESENIKYFAMPKLKASLKQSSPFIHFDLDSLVFTKPVFLEKETPFVFSHPDISIGNSNKKNKIPKDKNKAINYLINDNWFNGFMDTYLLPYYKCEWLPEDFPKHLIKPSNIPNMSFTGVKDVKTYKKAIRKSIEIAEKNEKILGNHWMNSCFIEQFVVSCYLEYFSKEYENSLYLGDTPFSHILHKNVNSKSSPFLFSNEPLTSKKIDNFNWSDLDYPITFQNNYQCGECMDYHTREIIINTKEELIDYLDFSKFKYIHLGYRKNIPLYQAMIIHTIINHYGKEVLFKVTDAYRKFYNKKKLPNIFNEGEILYEEVTGDKIFTKEFRNLKSSLI